MLVNLKGVILKAWNEGYAVPAFDCTEDILLRTILDTAEEKNSPVILMALEDDLKGRGMDYITSMVKGVAHKYKIPIVLHLDHATDIQLIKRAIYHGFTSVMYDGSDLSFDENVSNTKEVVEFAKKYNVTVEAELGRVGGNETKVTDMEESLLTDPKEVLKFVEETKVDALAVSIGTAHGVYIAEPKLNIETLKEINEISTVPLVLHGGSGTPENQVKDAIKNGISKVNLYADLRIAMYEGLNETANSHDRVDPLPNELFLPIKENLRKVIVDKIEMVGSKDKG